MRLVALVFTCYLLFGATPTRELEVIPGIGVPGSIELGWTKEQLLAHLGKQPERINHWRSCIRWDERYRHYAADGIWVYLDRYNLEQKHSDRRLNWIRFDSTSHAQLFNGIRIGVSTRADVYALYGPNLNNPGVEYDSLGVGFLFDCNLREKDHSQEKLLEIEVFTPLQCE